ncbi:hypothetical protein [Kribbella ginsengisoli]
MRTQAIVFALALCIGAGTIFQIAPAEAGYAQQPPKPTSPPSVVVKPTKDGVGMQGRQKRSGRLETGRPPKAGKSSQGSKGQRPKGTENSAPLANPVEDDDFRAGIGICGFPGGNAPQLTRCLPAMEDDLPDQPDQPVDTPSNAVVIRIPRPEDVQWEQVLAESKNVLFPKLGVKVQPAGRTLVNLDTIVYTDESRAYRQTVTVLGFPVAVEAMPMSYTWRFGDGASVTTTTPGRPYPAKDITHKYMKKHWVNLTVTTNYAARFNVAGTGWQYIDGTVPITGPATALQVREAVPVLVKPGG